MNKRKRLLLVAYYYPPRPGVGSRRTAQLRKYLPQYGWDVTVLTARGAGNGATPPEVVATNYVDVLGSIKRRFGLDGVPTHHRLGVEIAYAGETSKSLRQRAVSLAYQACTFPDREVGWMPFAAGALRNLVASDQFDAVMASSPPYVAWIVAALAASSIPWIADIRDLWTGTDTIEREPAVRWLERRLERWTLQRASAITVVSKPMAEVVARDFPGVPVTTVYNAFDPDDWADVAFESNDRATLLFAGSFYRRRAQPAPLFRAVRRLLDRGMLAATDLHIDVYSDETGWVARTAESDGVHHIVRTFDFVSHDEIVRLERRADRLLYFAWDSVGSETIVSAKIIEYLAARRPVLAVGGGRRSAIDDVLAQTGGGIRCTAPEQIESEVLNAVREFKERRARIISAEAVAGFEASHLASQVAAVLDGVVDGRRSMAR